MIGVSWSDYWSYLHKKLDDGFVIPLHTVLRYRERHPELLPLYGHVHKNKPRFLHLGTKSFPFTPPSFSNRVFRTQYHYCVFSQPKYRESDKIKYVNELFHETLLSYLETHHWKKPDRVRYVSSSTALSGWRRRREKNQREYV